MLRLKNPRDANNRLFTKLNNMVDFLAEEIGSTSQHERITYAERLVDGLKPTFRGRYIGFILSVGGRKAHRLWCDICKSTTSPETPELKPSDKIEAAIAVKQYTIVQKLLPSLLAQFDEPDSYMPYSPLKFAAEQGDVALMDTVLQFLRSLNLKENDDAFRRLCGGYRGVLFPINEVIDMMIRKMDIATVEILLDFHDQYLPKPRQSRYDEWATTAIITRSDKVSSLVLDFTYWGKSMVTALQTIPTACQQGKEYAIEAVLDRLPFGINDGTILTLPLFIAVRSGNTVAVQALLDLGAEIDISVKSNWRSVKKASVTPLDVAIYRKQLEIISCLIDNGATVPHISEWPEHKKSYDLLRDAEMLRTGASLPTQLQHKLMTPKELHSLRY